MKKTVSITGLAKDQVYSVYDENDLGSFFMQCEETRKSMNGQIPFFMKGFPDQVVLAVYPLIELSEAGKKHFGKKPSYRKLPDWQDLKASGFFKVTSEEGRHFVEVMKDADLRMATRIVLAVGFIRGTIDFDLKKNRELLKKSKDKDKEKELGDE